MPRDVFVHGKRVRCPNAVSDFHAYLLDQHEFEMLRLMNKVTEKDSWDIRIFDPQTVERWRLELLRSTWTPDGLRVSERGFNHCVAELRDKATNLDKTQCTLVLDTSDATVVKSDSAICKTDRENMKSVFRKLDRKTLQCEDRRFSEGSVLHIVNPALYSLRKRNTLITPTRFLYRSEAVDHIHEGEVWEDYSMWDYRLPYQDRSVRNNLDGLPELRFWSGQYQWLPADVVWGKDGDAKLGSYINNLHPDNGEAYLLIERAIDASIPLWNQSQVFIHVTDIPSPALNLVEAFPDGIQVIVRLTTIELTLDRSQLYESN
ncbi:hypothetical protein SLS57_003144 [Botryosphaeria dothidea]